MTVALSTGRDNGSYTLDGQASCVSPGMIQIAFGTAPSCHQSSGELVACEYLLSQCSGIFPYSLYEGAAGISYLTIVGLCGMVYSPAMSCSSCTGSTTCASNGMATFNGTFGAAPNAYLSAVSNTGQAIILTTLQLGLASHAYTLTLTAEVLNHPETNTTFTITGQSGCSNGLLTIGTGNTPSCKITPGPSPSNVLPLCAYFTQRCGGIFNYSTYIDSDSGTQLAIDGWCGMQQNILLTCFAGCSGDSVACSASSVANDIVPGPGIVTTTNANGTVTLSAPITPGPGIDADCPDGAACTVSNTGVLTVVAGNGVSVSCVSGTCTVNTTGLQPCTAEFYQPLGTGVCYALDTTPGGDDFARYSISAYDPINTGCLATRGSLEMKVAVADDCDLHIGVDDLRWIVICLKEVYASNVIAPIPMQSFGIMPGQCNANFQGLEGTRCSGAGFFAPTDDIINWCSDDTYSLAMLFPCSSGTAFAALYSNDLEFSRANANWEFWA